MRENNRKHKGAFSAKEPYLLSGLIFCKECGRNYVGMTSTRRKNGNVYRYKKYGCNGRNKLQGCKATYINADALETYAFNLIKEKVATKEGLTKIKDEVNLFISSVKKEAKDNYTDSQKELKQVNKELQNCIAAVCNGLNSKELNTKIESLENRKNFLERELSFSQKCEDKASINVDKILEIMQKQFDNYESFSVEEKKSFFKSYIKKIEVDHSNLTFYFNLKSLDVDSTSDMEPLVRLQIRWRIPLLDIINFAKV